MSLDSAACVPETENIVTDLNLAMSIDSNDQSNTAIQIARSSGKTVQASEVGDIQSNEEHSKLLVSEIEKDIRFPYKKGFVKIPNLRWARGGK